MQRLFCTVLLIVFVSARTISHESRNAKLDDKDKANLSQDVATALVQHSAKFTKDLGMNLRGIWKLESGKMSSIIFGLGTRNQINNSTYYRIYDPRYEAFNPTFGRFVLRKIRLKVTGSSLVPGFAPVDSFLFTIREGTTLGNPTKTFNGKGFAVKWNEGLYLAAQPKNEEFYDTINFKLDRNKPLDNQFFDTVKNVTLGKNNECAMFLSLEKIDLNNNEKRKILKESDPFYETDHKLDSTFYKGRLESHDCNFTLSLTAFVPTVTVHHTSIGSIICAGIFFEFLEWAFNEKKFTGANARRFSMASLFLQMLFCSLISTICSVLVSSFSSQGLGLLVLSALCLLKLLFSYLNRFFSVISARGGFENFGNFRFVLLTSNFIFFFAISFILIVNFIFPSLLGATFFVLLSFWIPQIVKNVINGVPCKMHASYVLACTISRIIYPIYFLWFPGNFLEYPTNRLVCSLLVIYTMATSLIIIFQQKYGARFFLPQSLFPKPYDYHPKLTEEELETECVICMERLGTLPNGKKFNLSSPLYDQRYFMRTPCGHVFHTECLIRWLDVKMDCPVCRQDLPMVTDLD